MQIYFKIWTKLQLLAISLPFFSVFILKIFNTKKHLHWYAFPVKNQIKSWPGDAVAVKEECNGEEDVQLIQFQF